MSKAEERAKEYAEKFILTVDHRRDVEDAFIDGYEQAEEDLALTWKDVELLININEDINNEEAMTQVRSNKEHYEEVLKRFNDMFFH